MPTPSAQDAQRDDDRDSGASAFEVAAPGEWASGAPDAGPAPRPRLGEERLAVLLGRIAGGDRAALRSLYEAEAVRLRTVALRVTRDPAIADDVLHDVFVALVDAPDRFDPARGSARSFLTARIRYAALDHLRRRGREPPAGDVAEDVAGAIAQAERTSEGERIGRCLRRLEPRVRQLIVLTVVEGHTHAELARDFAMPLGTTKSLIRRGLLALRRCLDT